MKILKGLQDEIIRWYVLVEDIANDRLVKKICSSIIGGIREKGRPQKKWISVMRELIRARDFADES